MASRSATSGARRLRAALLFLFVALIVATGVLLVFFVVPGAIITALGAAGVGAVLIASTSRARGGGPAARHGAPPPKARLPETEPEPAMLAPAEPRPVRLILVIAGAAAALALILAASFFGWTIVGLAALLFFAIMIFMGAPVWVAATEESAEDSREEQGETPPSIR